MFKIDRKDLAIYFIYSFFALVFFFQFLTTSQIFGFRDFSRFFYPLRFLLVEQVKAGNFPLWNPYLYCGMPLLGDLQTGFFFPITSIFYLLPFDLAFNYFTIIHYFLASSFMYMLLRHYKAGRIPAFFAGIVFAYSGYLVSVSNMCSTLSSVVWLPLVVLWWDKLLVRIKNKEKYHSEFILTVIWVALVFLGGEPTIIYMTFWLMFVYFIFLYKNYLKNLLMLFLVFLVFSLLVSAQLLPFVEFLARSERTHAISQTNKEWSFPPREITNFVLPYSWGNITKPGDYGDHLIGKDNQPWLVSSYFGIIVLLLAFISLFKKDKITSFFWAVFFFSLILSFGKYTPLLAVLYKTVKGFNLIRYPVKYIFLVAFAIPILSGIGLQLFFDLFEEGKLRLFRGLLIAITFISALLILLISLFTDRAFNCFYAKFCVYPLPGDKLQELWKIFQFNIDSLNIAFIYLCLFLFCLYLLEKKTISKLVFGGLMVLMIFLNYASVNISILCPLTPNLYHKVTPNIAVMIKDKSLFRSYSTQELVAETRIAYGDKIEDALLENKDKLSANLLVPFHLFDLGGYESVTPSDHILFMEGFRGKIPAKIIKMFNVKYVANNKPVLDKRLTLRKHTKYEYRNLYLYENKDFWPRTFVVHAARYYKDRSRIPFFMLHDDFSPLTEVLLEEDFAGLKELNQKQNSVAKIVKYEPSKVVIETEIQKPGMLFLADSYYPGWKAFDNGKEIKILRANYLFRAVHLDKGKHTVVFAYNPISFRLGLIISTFTFGILMMVWWKKR